MVDIPDLQHQVMGYDRSATMFSPDGLLLQVEYAEKAVRRGSPSIGLNCADGILIVADKGKKDLLIIPESAEKIFEVDEHIMASAAGIVSDARILVNHIRLTAQQHKVTYDYPIDIESTIREISDIQQQYTQHPGVRPFGVALIVAGVDGNKSKLYTSDITGNYYEYTAVAIGENDDQIKEILRKEFKRDMKIDEGIRLCFKVFKKVLGNNYDIERFNVAYIKKENAKFNRLGREEIKKYG
ncbi:archaeal proteasome endopeptidase complex subunit alpha [Candidatus Pacearchaeota archaeon]|nr:archaeal proteasome endopeptidase complex subunit alpha [Candidatus Pacearchaeota archaeon]